MKALIAQLDEILALGTAETNLKIRSPISGHVITKYVREGQYVDEGMPLYDLAFQDPAHGVFLRGGPGWPAAEVYRTVDGGHTWSVLALS